MDDRLQGMEGEFLALAALRQGGENWLFSHPPLSHDGLQVAAVAGARASQVQSPESQPSHPENRGEKPRTARRPQTQLYVH